jgi:opacity protein-like surface antigen
MKKNLILGLLIISLSASNASAQDSTSTSFKIGLGIGAIGGSDFSGVSFDGKLKLGANDSHVTFVGVIAYSVALGLFDDSDLKEIGIGVEYVVNPSPSISPYFALNIASYQHDITTNSWLNPQTTSDNGIGVSLGAGIEIFPHAPLSLDLEGRLHVTNIGNYSQCCLHLLLKIL